VTASRDLGIGTLFALGSAAGFSLKAIFIKLAYPYGIDAVSLLCLRMLYALPVFLIVLWRLGWPQLNARQWLAMVALGLAGYYLSSLLDFVGLRYISAGLERLVLFVYPTLTVLLGMLWHRRPWDPRLGVPLALCYLGIALAVIHDLQFTGSMQYTLIGSALVLGAAFSFAAYLTLGGALIKTLGAGRYTALSLVIASIAIVLHFSLTHELASLRAMPWPVHAWTLAMAMIATVLPSFAQTAAIERIGAERMALIGTLGPVLTLGFSVWWLHEPLSIWQVLGAMLVIVGVRSATRMSVPQKLVDTEGKHNQ
jgi:drug/metabolite transporter (DMT)-like permease